MVRVDQNRVGQHVFKGEDPALDKGLLVLGLIELGIVDCVGILFCDSNRFGDLRAPDVAEMIELISELVTTFRRQIDRFFTHQGRPFLINCGAG